jgi:membrane protein DedA with SNARE-associated domain
MLTGIAIALGTLVSEDAACIGAGLLVARSEISAASAVIAATLGIFLGDVSLWAAGRLCGAGLLRWKWTRRALEQSETASREWIHQHAPWAILGSRFLPGTRVPLYVYAGFVNLPARVFASWSCLASVLWTPIVVLSAAALGNASPLVVASERVRDAVQALTVGLPLLLLLIRSIRLKFIRGLTRGLTPGQTPGPSAWTRGAARVARWRRWEFWPAWLFYAPVAAWVALLAIRFRGLATVTAANPGMPDGGTIGESKFDILTKLPSRYTIPAACIEPDNLSDRVRAATGAIVRLRWSFPIVLKPDIGQRGVGVRLARSIADVESYLRQQTARVILQPYHPGPYEAGVFYYRMPGAARGRILSITDKQFPAVIGDGLSTLETLIWNHPRYRMQAGTFLERHGQLATWIAAAGERVQLAIAGNHAQGTVFRDGRHLWTDALERRIDAIAQACPGFFVGRFDIRYTDVDAFKAGHDLAIVELNGATAESTDIYDPDTFLFAAYRQLFRQWSIVFAIGAANRAAGAQVTSRRRLIALVHAHLVRDIAFRLAD